MFRIVSLLFFGSGAAALLFQTLWFRQAGLAFGTSVWAASLVLASFMGGLALGNAAMARLGDRIARPLRVYAGLELVIGCVGFVLVWLLPRLGPALAPLLRPLLEAPAALNAARSGAAFGLLLLPAAAMGATLPLLVGLLTERRADFGRRLAALYGWNTLGAVIGAIAGEGWLIARFGIVGTAATAAALNLICAAIALRLDAAAPPIPVSARPGTPAQTLRPVSSRDLALLAATFLAGGTLLALEVVWFRFLALFVHGTSLGFAVLLAVVLAGIGLGGLISSAWMARREGVHRLAPLVALLAGAVCARSYAGFDPGPADPSRQLATATPDIAGLATRLMLPTALLSGLLFPLLGTLLERGLGGATRAASLLTFSNTLGSMLGPLVAGLVLLPMVGVERSLFGLAAAYGVIALLALVGNREPGARGDRLVLAGAGVLWLAVLLAFPFGAMASRFWQVPIARFSQMPETRLVASREGATETLLYLRTDRFGEPRYVRMVTNGFSMSGTNVPAQRYMKTFVYLPMALRPQSRDALLISFGVGMTAQALADTRGLQHIDVVDISRDAIEMSDVVHPDPRRHPLRDPRVRVHVEDGRYFLQTTDRRYDLITGEPPPPKNAGIANLYSREYFTLMRERLVTGGLASYWLPVHSLQPADARAILRAFCDVFRDCSLWKGAALDWILLGSRDGVEAPSEDGFTAQWRDPEVAPALAAVGLETPEQLGALFLADGAALAERIGDAAPVVDDRPARISSDAPNVSVTFPEFAGWMDTERAREAFERSDFVKQSWPPALRRRTLAAFPAQRLLDQAMLVEYVGNQNTIGDLHELLTRSSLVTAPLWLLFSDAREQEIARAAAAQGRSGPELEYVLALGELAERRYDAAAERFARAMRGRSRPDSPHFHVYALCLAGRADEARAAAAILASRPEGGGSGAEFWVWMDRLCGLRPFVDAGGETGARRGGLPR